MAITILSIMMMMMMMMMMITATKVPRSNMVMAHAE